MRKKGTLVAAGSIPQGSKGLRSAEQQVATLNSTWLRTNRYGIENLANLDKVPAAGATLVVGAPTHRGGSGGPARIMALV